MVAQNAMANPMANVGPTPIKGHEANAMAHAGCVKGESQVDDTSGRKLLTYVAMKYVLP
jgi:hypothetical protein